jgi:hypothetical protein
MLTLILILAIINSLVYGHNHDHMEYEHDNGHNGKITICHIPPGNPANVHTITISYNALDTHLAHGDYIGECVIDSPSINTNKPSTIPTLQPTMKPTHIPTAKPSNTPTYDPTHKPTYFPSQHPTNKPTTQPSNTPTHEPTSLPSQQPTHKPTNEQTHKPTSTACSSSSNNICSKYGTITKNCKRNKLCKYSSGYRFQPCDSRTMPCVNSGFDVGDLYNNYMDCSDNRYNKGASLNACVVLKKGSKNPAPLGCNSAYQGCSRLLGSESICLKANGCMTSYKSSNNLNFYCVKYNSYINYKYPLKNKYINSYDNTTVSFDCQNLPPGACTARLIRGSYILPETIPCTGNVYPGIVVYVNDQYGTSFGELKVYVMNNGNKYLVNTIKRTSVCSKECCDTATLFRFALLNIPFNNGSVDPLCKLYIEVDSGSALIGLGSPYY